MESGLLLFDWLVPSTISQSDGYRPDLKTTVEHTRGQVASTGPAGSGRFGLRAQTAADYQGMQTQGNS